MYSSTVSILSLLLAFSVCVIASPVSRDTNQAGLNTDSKTFDYGDLEARFFSILDELDTQNPLEVRADRPGQASDQHRCDVISGVPRDVSSALRLNSFYRKYTHAYNIPVLGSFRVSDRALRRACYVVRFLLADRPDLRQAMYAKYGRVAIMATTEVTQNIPEHSFLPAFWNTRARGLGGTLQIPVSTGAEENVLCLRSDRYREDIFLHELAHGVHKIALTTAVPDYNRRLTNAYNSARRQGLWRNTYADDTVDEYFAEGVQSFFNVESPFVFGIHNDIDTREELASYDPTLYGLLREAFPCMNNIVDRCQNQDLIASQPLQMNCGGTTTGGTGGTGTNNNCVDNNQYCRDWANRGECQRNPGYMLINCALSCNQCRT
ncbi:hypothetical protein HOLleu_25746 [Holothuria leucospilota]|uniref:ShKT domain-containing protein n=1 Tax=Holothuria leucospilota TaxID=206669 RepID=A0A9Q1H4K4_HOLLE|nr:hypothetical protein HOLleu_25746 [Holothuria leucospilota]